MNAAFDQERRSCWATSTALLRVSTMDDAEWQILEDKYRVV